VVAWGQAMLSDDGVPCQFAVLEPDDRVGRGAYLIEDGTGRAWLISFEVDGRTVLWALTSGQSLDGDDAWQLRRDEAVEHAQGHHRGGERLVFALRGGRPVVLEHGYVEDADVIEQQRVTADGVCVEMCPSLDGFETADLQLEVEGPAPARSLGREPRVRDQAPPSS